MVDRSLFTDVENLFRKRSAALKEHERQLKSEVGLPGEHKPHAYARHGHQAGWEQQVIRAATGITPDQSFDPTGTGASIRTWRLASLGGVFGSVYTSLPPIGEYKTGGGDVAGGFATPEAQQDAVLKVKTKLAVVGQNTWAEFKDKTTNKKGMFPIGCVVLVEPAGAAGDGRFFGLGFARRNADHYTLTSRECVEALIAAYHARTTVAAMRNQLAALNPPLRVRMVLLNRAPTKPLCESVDELLDLLSLDVVSQKAVSGVFRRSYSYGRRGQARVDPIPYNRATGQKFVPGTPEIVPVAPEFNSPWGQITMFPSTDEPGWAPQLPKSFQETVSSGSITVDPKDALRKAGMSCDVNNYVWTGRTSDTARVVRTHVVPAWAK